MKINFSEMTELDNHKLVKIKGQLCRIEKIINIHEENKYIAILEEVTNIKEKQKFYIVTIYNYTEKKTKRKGYNEDNKINAINYTIKK